MNNQLEMALNRVYASKGQQAPIMMQEGGEIDAMAAEQMMAPGMGADAELEAAVNELMMARDTAEDPMEAAKAEQMAEAAVVGAQAPMADMAAQLSAAGRGEDTQLAHLRPGEVILPPEMFDDANFEAAVESRFNDLDLDPERYVVGMGIASLNPSTGLEEFGFFKKVGKFFKKVVKKVAPIAGPLANFIPGVGPVLAGAIGAATNVAAGKGLKGAISGALGGYGAGKALGGIGSLGGASGGSAANFAKSGFFDKIGALRKGLGSLPGEGFFGKVGEFILPGADDAGLIKNLGKAGSYMLGAPRGSEAELLQQLKMQALESGDPSQLAAFEGLEGLSPQDALKTLQERGVAGASGGNFLSGLIRGGGADGRGNFGLVGDVLGGGLGGGQGGGLLGGGGLGGTLAAGGVAALLGKLAYDEAKNRKGVPLTPLTQMDAMGRYNIEAEIARRMGKEKPSAVEFSLLPERTLPQLSGGRPTPRFNALPVGLGSGIPLRNIKPYSDRESAGEMNPMPAVMMNGGMVAPMRYAEGGNVATEDFERMNGDINGPGTETSDDVPAMLSDGEFVMTGRAVRGAGAFDMARGDGGIITLTPSKEEDRDRGTQLMYDMMDLFSEFAGART